MDDLKISLAAARVNAGLTQSEVAENMRVSKTTIVSWEKGYTPIGVAELDYLSRLYDMPLEHILLPKGTTKA